MSAGPLGMKAFAPTARLAQFVRAFEVVEAWDEMTRTLFPEPGIVLGFRYAGSSELIEEGSGVPVPDQVLTGLRGTVRRMRTSAGGGIVLAKFHERVAHLERFLLARLRPEAADPRVRSAVRALHETCGAVRIAVLADQLHLSQDALEKRFRRAVGATPKRLASMLRLRHALARYRPGASLSELALEAGYYDQSHFIREFKAATGEPPQRFFQLAEYC